MPFLYKQAVLIGATSGIGAALADRLVEAGVKVMAVGRRQDRLDSFVQKHGSDKTSSLSFDITDKGGLPGFVARVIKECPDLDCVVLNAGLQRQYNLSRPAEVDMDSFHHEVNTNFTSIVNLAMAFLPHLLAKEQPTALVFTGTNICIVPAFPLPAYSASKAALNAFVYCLRAQLSKTQTKVIEIWPPAVQSELHDYTGEERGRAIGMPMATFMDIAFPQLEAGSEEIIVGTVGTPDMETDFLEVANGRRKLVDSLTTRMMAHFAL